MSIYASFSRHTLIYVDLLKTKLLLRLSTTQPEHTGLEAKIHALQTSALDAVCNQSDALGLFARRREHVRENYQNELQEIECGWGGVGVKCADLGCGQDNKNVGPT